VINDNYDILTMLMCSFW